jgi:hypothetical protein
MSSDGGDSDFERPFGARPFGARPFGARPFGAREEEERPFGARPFGARPFGAREDDERPFGARPFGARPFGARPFGARPFGARPFGARPFGARGGDGPFDPHEWQTDIAELVCEYSAVIRVGSTLVFGESELQVPVVNALAAFRAPGAAAPPAAPAVQVLLQPGEWQLAVTIAAPLGVVSGVAARPDLAATLKVDLAEALARGLDQAALVGTPAGPGPRGIQNLLPPAPGPGAAELLRWMRDMVIGVRAADPVRSPAWVLTPAALTAIAEFLTGNGLDSPAVAPAPAPRSLDTFPLLTYDGADGGTLLGYPFLTARVNAGGGRGAYLSADWREALIGLDPSTVSVGVQGAAGAQVVVTATMPLDFNLRWPPSFAWI